jgi:carbon monoxide dehydrogenase subunit G
MKIEERLVIQAPIERVWAFVREPQTCAPCVPGCEGVEALSDTAYRVTVGIALGPIKARFNAVVTITEEAPPTRLVCQTKGEEGARPAFSVRPPRSRSHRSIRTQPRLSAARRPPSSGG